MSRMPAQIAGDGFGLQCSGKTHFDDMTVALYRPSSAAHQETGTNVHRPDRYNSKLFKTIFHFFIQVFVLFKESTNISELPCSGKTQRFVRTIALYRLLLSWISNRASTIFSKIFDKNGRFDTGYSYRRSPCPEDQAHRNMQPIPYQKDSVLRQYILNWTCVSIANTSKDVLRVIPSYQYGQSQNNIVFVVITRKELDALPNPKRYAFVQRSIDSYSDEGIELTNYIVEKQIWFSHEDSAKLRQCLQKHSDRLMKQHSNLTMISACSVKSTNYKEIHVDAFTRQCCIVLYVHVKGYIPDNEVAFPKHLDYIPVDVREGQFQFLGPRDHHQRLKMGCQIASNNKVGTLGPFFRHQNQTYCLTSAHAVLDDSALRDLYTRGELIYKHNTEPLIYQPSTEHPTNKFGRLVYAMHQPGGNANAGFEIAVIRVDDRLPDSGKFPDKYREQTGIERELYFSSGQTYDYMLLQSGFNVYMYGSQSGFTEGYFSLGEAGIRSETFRNKDGAMFQWEFTLHRQIIVHSAKRETPFAQPGDSGAMVFVANREDKSNIQALGILEGITPDGNYCVTPLSDILAAMSHPQMMTFTSGRTEDQIDSILEIVKNIQNMLNQ